MYLRRRRTRGSLEGMKTPRFSVYSLNMSSTLSVCRSSSSAAVGRASCYQGSVSFSGFGYRYNLTGLVADDQLGVHQQRAPEADELSVGAGDFNASGAEVARRLEMLAGQLYAHPQALSDFQGALLDRRPR
jgi:hypothetical protein